MVVNQVNPKCGLLVECVECRVFIISFYENYVYF